jgi:hypothetical protein
MIEQLVSVLIQEGLLLTVEICGRSGMDRNLCILLVVNHRASRPVASGASIAATPAMQSSGSASAPSLCRPSYLVLGAQDGLYSSKEKLSTETRVRYNLV